MTFKLTLNFTLDDNEESIERKVSDFFSQETIYEKKAINDRFNDDIRDAGELPNNRVRHLPSNYKKETLSPSQIHRKLNKPTQQALKQ